MENQTNQVEKYLLQQMAPDEEAAFLKELKNNENMQQELQLQKDLLEGISRRAEKRLKTRIGEIQAQVDQENKSAPRMKLRPFLMAASFIMLLGMAWLFFLYSGSFSVESQQLFAQNYTAYDWQNDRGGSMDDQIAIIAAVYGQQDYPKVIQAIQALPENQISAELQLVLGTALLESGRSLEAANAFQQAAQNPLFKQEANWYLGLNALKEDDLESARSFFELAAEPANSSIGKQAQKLIRKLD